MTWTNGGKGSRFSAKTKRTVKRRDQGLCQLQYPGCLVIGSQYDHIASVAKLGISRDDPAADDPNNLRLVCEPCHRHHSSMQGHAAKRAKRFRKPLEHPGLVRKTDDDK